MCHHVDRVTEERPKLLLQSHQIEQRTTRLELHQEVQVALWAFRTPCDGAEERDRLAPMPRNGLLDLSGSLFNE